MERIEFTDDEIKEQLAALGYFNVSEAKLSEFRRDLTKLVHHDISSGNSSWITGPSSPEQSDASPNLTQNRRPNLSRYQPHVKVTPRTESREQRPTASTVTTSSPNVINQTSDFSTSLASSPRNPNMHFFEYTHKENDDMPRSSPRVYEHRQSRSPLKSKEPSSSLFSYEERTNINETRPKDIVIETESSFTNHETSHNTTNDFDASQSSNGSPSYGQPKLIRKRKVVRKQTDGTSQVFDESLMTDGSESFRNHDVSIDDEAIRYGINDRLTLPNRPQSAVPYVRRSPNIEQMKNDPLPSFIRPNTAHPHTRNIRKTDPVNKYFKYKESWNNVKAPGEKSHKDLRWQVKAQMMCKDEPPPKPQRIFVPNTYVVPTSKKRSTLRWEVRHALERGYPVPSFS